MSKHIRNWVLAAGLVLTSAGALLGQTGPADARAPLPDATALREAGKLVDGVYKNDVAAAKTVEQKKLLAHKWLKAAQETKNDPAGRYVLLGHAKDLAGDTGDIETALAAAGELAGGYQTDGSNIDADVLGRLLKSARGAGEFKAITRYANGAANEAIGAERWEAARRLAEIAAAASAKAEDPALAKLSVNRPRDVREAETAAKSAARLQTAAAQPTPEGQKAAAEVGRYRLLLGDIKRGLPLLAQSTDPLLHPVAEKDQANPPAGDAMVAVADAWWDAAEKSQGLAKIRMQLRARELYQQSVALVAGLPKAKAEQRVKETELTATVYGPKAAGPIAVASAVPSNPPPGLIIGGVAPGYNPAAAANPSTPAAPGPLPQGTFSREWTQPQAWVGKPEQVTVAGTKISVTNDGGKNTVYADADIVKESDGVWSVSWNKSATQMGYEVWTVNGKEITIQRWNSKDEKTSGQAARRVGRVTK